MRTKILKTFFVFSIVLAALAQNVFALDWIKVHDTSDDTSVKSALQAVQNNPESMESLYALGVVYLYDYDHTQAAEVFRKMLSSRPESFEAAWGIAECLRREHDFKKAKPILERIIKSHLEYAPAFITLAYIKYIEMEFVESAKLSAKVINLGRKNVDHINYLRAHGLYAAAKGMIAHYAGPLSKAINGAAVLRHLRIIENIDPDSVVVLFGMGELLYAYS